MSEDYVLLRGGAFGECLVGAVEHDVDGLFIEKVYNEVEQAVLHKEKETFIYTNTGRRELHKTEEGVFHLRVFEVDFRAMREIFQYEMVM